MTAPAARPPPTVPTRAGLPPPAGPGSGEPGDHLANIGGIRHVLKGTSPARRPPPARPPTAAERAAHRRRLDELAERYPERYAEFRYNDPDHRGTTGSSQEKEATIALDRIESGLWPPSLRRPTDSGDFVDEATGQKWDIKGFHSDYPDEVPPDARKYPFEQAVTPESFTSAMERQLRAPRTDVVLDVRMVDGNALDFMTRIVEEKGWSDRVEWYP